jgi:hypothetical protein
MRAIPNPSDTARKNFLLIEPCPILVFSGAFVFERTETRLISIFQFSECRDRKLTTPAL